MIRLGLLGVLCFSAGLYADQEPTDIEFKLRAGANPLVSAETVWGGLTLRELFEWMEIASQRGSLRVVQRIKDMIRDRILNQELDQVVLMFDENSLKSVRNYIIENFDRSLGDRAQDAREFLADRIYNAQTLKDVIW